MQVLFLKSYFCYIIYMNSIYIYTQRGILILLLHGTLTNKSINTIIHNIIINDLFRLMVWKSKAFSLGDNDEIIKIYTYFLKNVTIIIVFVFFLKIQYYEVHGVVGCRFGWRASLSRSIERHSSSPRCDVICRACWSNDTIKLCAMLRAATTFARAAVKGTRNPSHPHWSSTRD